MGLNHVNFYTTSRRLTPDRDISGISFKDVLRTYFDMMDVFVHPGILGVYYEVVEWTSADVLMPGADVAPARTQRLGPKST